jgi:hypothetical protein
MCVHVSWELGAEAFMQYNETLNDLLGEGEFDKKKHEIKHEKGSTRVTDTVTGKCQYRGCNRAALTLRSKKYRCRARIKYNRYCSWLSLAVLWRQR